MEQNQREKRQGIRREKVRRRAFIFLWVLVVLGLCLLLEYRFHFLRRIGKEKDYLIGPGESRFSFDGQETLLVSGELLYYSDLNRAEALCSYNLKTKEVQVLEQTKGVLKKTGTGMYYVTEAVVYRLEGETLSVLSPVPEGGSEFVDFYEGRLYCLTAGEKPEKAGEGELRDRRSIYIQEPVSLNGLQLLYQTDNAVTIRDAVLVHQRLYVMADDGIYAIEPLSGETIKLSGLCSFHCVSDGVHIVFEGTDEGKKELHYYEIVPDGQIVKRTDDAGVGAVYQGKLYYNSSGLRVCDLTVADGESSLLGEVPLMCFMTVSAQGVFLRDCLQNSIWFYDLDSGEKECIIPQK